MPKKEKLQHGDKALLGRRVGLRNLRLHQAAPSSDMERMFLPFVLINYGPDDKVYIMMHESPNIYTSEFNELIFSSADFLNLQKAIHNLF